MKGFSDCELPIHSPAALVPISCFWAASPRAPKVQCSTAPQAVPNRTNIDLVAHLLDSRSRVCFVVVGVVPCLLCKAWGLTGLEPSEVRFNDCSRGYLN